MADGLSIGNLNVSGGLARLTGSSSKLDTDAIVAAAYAAKRQPAVRLEQRRSDNDAKLAALGQLQSLLGTLKESLNGLRNPPGLLGGNENVFETKQAFLSSGGGTAPEQLLGVTAANAAAAGTFSVSVERLATAQKLAARPVGATDQTLADAWNGGTAFSGSLELGLAGGPKTGIAVSGSMKLQDLRAAINAVSSQTGVVANVLAVSGTDYRLVLTASATGKPIELTAAGGDDVATLLGAGEIQAAQSARLQIDGVTIERPGNRIDDAVPGVTFELYRAEPGSTVAVEVAPSLNAAKEQIARFVAAYNAVRGFVAEQGVVSDQGAVAAGAVLFGDRTLRSVAQMLGDSVGGATPGIPAGALSTLRDIGISLEAGGTLKIDEAVLDARLSGKLPELRRVFEFTAITSSGDLSVYTRTNALADRSFTVVVSDPNGDGVPDAATFDGVAAEIAGGTIRGADGTPYAGLKLIWAGRGDASIDVTVSQGVADRLYNALDDALDLFDGPIQQAIDSLGAANAGFAKQIEQIDGRAAAARDRLLARFSAMESALSVANTMLDQIRAQIDAFNGQN